jgi:hypothetical protein
MSMLPAAIASARCASAASGRVSRVAKNTPSARAIASAAPPMISVSRVVRRASAYASCAGCSCRIAQRTPRDDW